MASALTEVCPGVSVELRLPFLSGETFMAKITTRDDEARIDISLSPVDSAIPRARKKSRNLIFIAERRIPRGMRQISAE